MPVTQDEIEAFCEFAIKKINNGGVESLRKCLQLWEEEREHQATVAAIREAEADIAAGRTKPLDQAFADIRRDLGLSPQHAVQ